MVGDSVLAVGDAALLIGEAALALLDAVLVTVDAVLVQALDLDVVRQCMSCTLSCTYIWLIEASKFLCKLRY